MAFYPDEATPIFVVGRQRAGTRFLTNALNRFPEICIQGEIPSPVAKVMQDFFTRVDRYYENLENIYNPSWVGKQRYEKWSSRKQHLMFVLFANINQSFQLSADKNSCKYFGYKTPKHEFHFDYYVEFFQDNVPIFLYCIRNFVDNYLSVNSRWPQKNIEFVANEYVESIEQYQYMKKSYPDNVLLFNLDDFLKHGVNYLSENIFDSLDIEQTAPIIEEIRKMGPVNTLEEIGIDRRRALTGEEINYLKSRPELEKLHDDVCILS